LPTALFYGITIAGNDQLFGGIKMDLTQPLMTPRQVARRVQVQVRTVTMWLRNGQLRGHKIGKGWRISNADLEAFLDRSANIKRSV
jgi:excisionase family DNA binding protein